MYPPSWLRLNADPKKGAEGLTNELGSSGYLAVAFSENGEPVACGGILPYRGDGWINAAFVENPDGRSTSSWDAEQAKKGLTDGTSTSWEICCFCTHPSERRKGLSHQLIQALKNFAKSKHGERLYTNYARDETGVFWTRFGFEVVPGADSVLPKGFKVEPEKEGLRDDIHYRTAVMDLR